jgi:hypothetical protein
VTRPKAATNSANHCAPPVRAFIEKSTRGAINMKCATMVTIMPPETLCDHVQQSFLGRQLALAGEHTGVTAGLKWAPKMGPRTVISTTRIAPVGKVLQRRASATSLVRASAMMPEPTTVVTRIPVPSASAAKRREIKRVHQLAFEYEFVWPPSRPISRIVPSGSLPAFEPRSL